MATTTLDSFKHETHDHPIFDDLLFEHADFGFSSGEKS